MTIWQWDFTNITQPISNYIANRRLITELCIFGKTQHFASVNSFFPDLFQLFAHVWKYYTDCSESLFDDERLDDDDDDDEDNGDDDDDNECQVLWKT